MITRAVLLSFAVMLPGAARAVEIPGGPGGRTVPGQHMMEPGQGMMGQGQHMMDEGQHMMGPAVDPDSVPVEPGQSAFAAIQEIVEMLDADPQTDWSKVNIDALRAHLVDMDNVTLRAKVKSEPVPNGMRFTVSGEGEVRESIRRMLSAHALTMDGQSTYTLTAEEVPTGAQLTVVAADKVSLAKLKGLGFFGVITLGMHHQEHHMALATGQNPHGH